MPKIDRQHHRVSVDYEVVFYWEDAASQDGAPCASASWRRAAVGEDVGASAAMRAEGIAHVLDHAEQRHGDLLEHGDAEGGVDQREVLRRRDDHRAGQRHVLRHRQLGVAGAGGMSTTSTSSSPHSTLRRDWSAPKSPSGRADDRRALPDQKADRHHLDAEFLDRP